MGSKPEKHEDSPRSRTRSHVLSAIQRFLPTISPSVPRFRLPMPRGPGPGWIMPLARSMRTAKVIKVVIV